MTKLKAKKIRLKSLLNFLMAFILFSALFCNSIYFKGQAKETESGTVTASSLNVRTSPGVNGNTNRLTSDGAYVVLSSGTNVTVTKKEYASDGSLWYAIIFNYKGKNLSGYVSSSYISIDVTYTYDESFEKYLTAQGFPESYKEGLRKIHAKYPNWVFVADHVEYNFSDVVENENYTGRSLIHATSISSWKRVTDGVYNWDTNTYSTFDGSSWVCASKELIAYTLDPRNFLDETNIFQFELLSYDSSVHTTETVNGLLEGSFMENTKIDNSMTYADALIAAAKTSKVSPFHLASRIMQEVGVKGTSAGISGYYAPSTGNVYTNLYNYYNIGAYAAQGRGAIENGLIYASKTDDSTLRPWNSRYKAIVGGAIFIGTGFINIGQDTIYYEKFDLVGTPYSHQYMTNVLAPRSEAASMASAYSDSMKSKLSLTFKIPVYNNMPATVCGLPYSDDTPSKSINSSSGTYNKGVYTSVEEMEIEDVSEGTNISIDKEKIPVISDNNIININPATSTADFKEYIKYANGLNDVSISVISKNNTEKESGKICTGDKVNVYDKQGNLKNTYNCIIYGDVNGDGYITIMDMVYVKRHLLNIKTLDGAYLLAANATRDTELNILDMVYIKRSILGIIIINQK